MQQESSAGETLVDTGLPLQQESSAGETLVDTGLPLKEESVCETLVDTELTLQQASSGQTLVDTSIPSKEESVCETLVDTELTLQQASSGQTLVDTSLIQQEHSSVQHSTIKGRYIDAPPSVPVLSVVDSPNETLASISTSEPSEIITLIPTTSEAGKIVETVSEPSENLVDTTPTSAPGETLASISISQPTENNIEPTPAVTPISNETLAYIPEEKHQEIPLEKSTATLANIISDAEKNFSSNIEEKNILPTPTTIKEPTPAKEMISIQIAEGPDTILPEKFAKDIHTESTENIPSSQITTDILQKNISAQKQVISSNPVETKSLSPKPIQTASKTLPPTLNLPKTNQPTLNFAASPNPTASKRVPLSTPGTKTVPSDNPLADSIWHNAPPAGTQSKIAGTTSGFAVTRIEGTNLCLGSVIGGKYKIIETLGKGGMGIVFKVEHLLLPNKKYFALKLLHSHLSQDESFRKRFVREVEMAMEFTHENAIQIRDFGEIEDGSQYFTMDFSTGRSLGSIVKSEGCLSFSRSVHIVKQVLGALRQAHAKGIVHRDLKPDNILIEYHLGKDHPLVLDFGIAKLFNESGEEKLTQKTAIGTPLYMSPEQASGEGVDNRTDLYSMGVILYQLITAKLPFTGPIRDVLFGHMVKPVPPPREVRPDLNIPESLQRIILKALEKDRKDRFSNAQEFIDALEEFEKNPQATISLSTSETASATLPISSALGMPKKSSSIRKVSSILFTILVLICALGYWVHNTQIQPFQKYTQEFSRLIEDKKFEQAESVLQRIEHLWFYHQEAFQMLQRLNLAKAEESIRKAKEAEEKAEAERKAEEERKAKEAEDKAEAERKAKEAEDKAEAERKAKEAEDKAEAERKAKELAEQKAKEAAAKAEAERKARELAEKQAKDLAEKKAKEAVLAAELKELENLVKNGQQFFALKQYAAAQQQFSQFFAKNGEKKLVDKSSIASRLLGICYYKSKNYEQALFYLNKVAAEKNILVLGYQGLCLYELGQKDNQALSAIESALKSTQTKEIRAELYKARIEILLRSYSYNKEEIFSSMKNYLNNFSSVAPIEYWKKAGFIARDLGDNKQALSYLQTYSQQIAKKGQEDQEVLDTILSLQNYQPLAMGNMWRYKVHIHKTNQMSEIFFRVVSDVAGQYSVQDNRGDTRIWTMGNGYFVRENKKMFPIPVTLYANWDRDSQQQARIIAVNELVKTDAGEFYCIVVQVNSISNSSFMTKEYYAPNVGEVRAENYSNGQKTYQRDLIFYLIK